MLSFLITGLVCAAVGLLVGFVVGYHKGYYHCLNEPAPPALSDAEKAHGYFEPVHRDPAAEAQPFVRGAEPEERAN